MNTLSLVTRVARFTLVPALVLLSACSKSPDDQVYDLFRCAKAAQILQDYQKAEHTMRKVQDIPRSSLTPLRDSQYAMQLGQRFQDDYELYKYNVAAQIVIVKELHDSSLCQELYK